MNGRLGRYTLLTRLGSGGTAEVWRARLDGESGFSRDVVLKRLRPELACDPELVARLRKEARVVARLSHSNIVQVYEVFEASGETVLVMEHVRGCDLLDVLRAHDARGTRVPPGVAAYVAREAARGLASAHTHLDESGALAPVVHRDINPANVMLGSDGSVRVIDFGFAKIVEAFAREQTATGVLFGKVGYFAPELLADVGRRTPPDPRCDQFALGVVLHEMLTGQRVTRTRGARLPAPSLACAGVPASLDRICARMMETDPEARYASCHDVAEALDQVTGELGSGALQAAAHLESLALTSTAARHDDPARETEDAGAAVVDDTVVDAARPSPVGHRWRRPSQLASLLLLVLAIAFAWTRTRRSPEAATAPLRPAQPLPLGPLIATPPAPRSLAVQPSNAEPARSITRPSAHVARPRPAPHPASSYAGQPSPSLDVSSGTIYDPFK